MRAIDKVTSCNLSKELLTVTLKECWFFKLMFSLNVSKKSFRYTIRVSGFKLGPDTREKSDFSLPPGKLSDREKL